MCLRYACPTGLQRWRIIAGDHLVGWANSSIRHPDQLPQIASATPLTGVFREDPLAAAVHPCYRTLLDKALANGGHDSEPHLSKAGSQPQVATDRQGVDVTAEASCSQTPRQLDNAAETGTFEQRDIVKGAGQSEQHSQKIPQHSQPEQQAAEKTVDSSKTALLMLKRLQSMPWRRIDVSFQGTRMPFLAHNHIQVTRRWLNWYGNAVCQHLAQQLADMEKNLDIQEIRVGLRQP